jgi:hypothetical protein
MAVMGKHNAQVRDQPTCADTHVDGTRQAQARDAAQAALLTAAGRRRREFKRL